jgi:excisionase family DNA binding protein
MDTRDLVDINEAQRITGLDKDTIYKLARQKRIRSFKVIGSALRFERSDLVSLVEERPAHV